MKTNESKIFGLSLGKCGSKSLHRAMQVLGYTSVHYPKSFSLIESCQAAIDATVTAYWDELAVIYPDARWFFLFRNKDDWIKSWGHRENWVQKNYPNGLPLFVKVARVRLFGQVEFDQTVWTKAYWRFKDNAQKFIEHCPDRAIFWDLCANPGWEPLCDFLKCSIPDTPFPLIVESEPNTSEAPN